MYGSGAKKRWALHLRFDFLTRGKSLHVFLSSETLRYLPYLLKVVSRNHQLHGIVML